MKVKGSVHSLYVIFDKPEYPPLINKNDEVVVVNHQITEDKSKPMRKGLNVLIIKEGAEPIEGVHLRIRKSIEEGKNIDNILVEGVIAKIVSCLGDEKTAELILALQNNVV